MPTKDKENTEETVNTDSLEQQLLKALPKNLKITGLGLERKVMIEDENNTAVLDLKAVQKVTARQETFNWGYTGVGPMQLALGILLQYMPARMAQMYKTGLAHYFIKYIEPNNFEANIKLRTFYTELLKEGKIDKSNNDMFFTVKELNLEAGR